MSTIRLVLAAALFLALSAAAARPAQPEGGPGEATLDVLLDTIRANRQALVAVNLNLGADEAARFWPLYERYQKELNATGDRLVAVIEDYEANFRTLSNEKAIKLVEEYLAIEAERVKLRQTYLPEFAKILPGRTVARFYQIENKMDAVVRYDLAATIPVVEEESPAR
jgi:hypothetical protein